VNEINETGYKVGKDRGVDGHIIARERFFYFGGANQFGVYLQLRIRELPQRRPTDPTRTIEVRPHVLGVGAGYEFYFEHLAFNQFKYPFDNLDKMLDEQELKEKASYICWGDSGVCTTLVSEMRGATSELYLEGTNYLNNSMFVTPFWRVSKNDDGAVVDPRTKEPLILGVYEWNDREYDKWTDTPLQLAVKADDHVTLNQLLRSRAKKNLCFYPNHLLQVACAKNRVRVAKALLESDKAACVANTTDLLLIATCCGHEGVVKLLLDYGAEPWRSEHAALRAACWLGHIDILRLLLDELHPELDDPRTLRALRNGEILRAAHHSGDHNLIRLVESRCGAHPSLRTLSS
jgi:hypothetical protein